ncbi:MAG: hypothetical protein LV481_07060 [Methylacidiphilales bacterium]|nr:hypothetical protein [Candidatus Methylacidiphilales bacterium]
MKPFRLLILALPLFLAACGPTAQQQADYARVERAGVSPAIYDKMVHGDPLSISDIESLSRAHVNSGIILRYLRDHGTVYYLSAADVKQMEKAGVDPSIVDYMLQTAQGGWWGPGPYPYYGAYDPYWGGPFFYGGFYGGGWYHGGYYHGGYYHGGGHGWHH